jgi:hypothetical protein
MEVAVTPERWALIINDSFLSFTMSNYPQAPPSYSATKPASALSDDEPLLGGYRSPQAGPSSGAIYNQPAAGDLPDDFKVCAMLIDIMLC